MRESMPQFYVGANVNIYDKHGKIVESEKLIHLIKKFQEDMRNEFERRLNEIDCTHEDVGCSQEKWNHYYNFDDEGFCKGCGSRPENCDCHSSGKFDPDNA